MGCFKVILKPLGSLSTILITKSLITIMITDQDILIPNVFLLITDNDIRSQRCLNSGMVLTDSAVSIVIIGTKNPRPAALWYRTERDPLHTLKMLKC